MSLDLFPGFSLNVLRIYNLGCVYEIWTKTTARQSGLCFQSCGRDFV